MALIECPNCGRQISDKAEKCPGCGYELPEIQEIETESIEDVKEIVCEECGMIIPEGATICPNCGCPISEFKNDDKLQITKDQIPVESIDASENTIENTELELYNNDVKLSNKINKKFIIAIIILLVITMIIFSVFAVISYNNQKKVKSSLMGTYFYSDTLKSEDRPTNALEFKNDKVILIKNDKKQSGTYKIKSNKIIINIHDKDKINIPYIINNKGDIELQNGSYISKKTIEDAIQGTWQLKEGVDEDMVSSNSYIQFKDGVAKYMITTQYLFSYIGMPYSFSQDGSYNVDAGVINVEYDFGGTDTYWYKYDKNRILLTKPNDDEVWTSVDKLPDSINAIN